MDTLTSAVGEVEQLLENAAQELPGDFNGAACALVQLLFDATYEDEHDADAMKTTLSKLQELVDDNMSQLPGGFHVDICRFTKRIHEALTADDGASDDGNGSDDDGIADESGDESDDEIFDESEDESEEETDGLTRNMITVADDGNDRGSDDGNNDVSDNESCHGSHNGSNNGGDNGSDDGDVPRYDGGNYGGNDESDDGDDGPDGNLREFVTTFVESRSRLRRESGLYFMYTHGRDGPFDWSDAIAATGGIRPLVRKLVKMLQRRNGNSAVHAAGVLAKIANERTHNQNAIAAVGGVTWLVCLARTGDDDQKQAATSALCSLAKYNPGLAVAITNADSIPPLVTMLRGGTEDQKYTVTDVFTHLLRGDAAKVEIEAAGGIPPLVAFVRNTSTHVGMKVMAIEALGILAVDNATNQAAIVAARGISALVRMVRDSDNDENVKCQAATALTVLCKTSTANQDALAAAGGIPLLVAMLRGRHPSPQKEECAMRALLKFAKGNATIRAHIAAADGLHTFLQFLFHAKTEFMKDAAIAMVGHLAGNVAAQEAIAAAHAIPFLVLLTQEGGTPHRKLLATFVLLTITSYSDAYNASIEAAGGIPPHLLADLAARGRAACARGQPP